VNPGYFNSRDFYWWVSCSCSCACSCTCCSGILFFRDTGGHVLPHNSAEPEHGQVHRNEDDGDEQADEQDQDWLEHTSERAEAVFERFSIEKLLEAKTINSVKDLLRATAQQAGTEASEEMLTEIANILSDTAIMGESSDFEQLVTQYQLMGMDEDEARKQAYLDSVAQVVWAGVGGALSGVAMGGATSGGRSFTRGPSGRMAKPSCFVR